jgi:hypothetical protein
MTQTPPNVYETHTWDADIIHDIAHWMFRWIEENLEMGQRIRITLEPVAETDDEDE